MKSEPKLAFLVRFETREHGQNPDLCVTARLVVTRGMTIRNLPDPKTWEWTKDYGRDQKDDVYPIRNGRGLDHLEISAWTDSKQTGALIGWSFDVFSDVYFRADYREIVHIAKGMKRIDSGLNSFDTRFGRPFTFGAWLCRIGDILGAMDYVTTETRHSSYDDNEYSWHDAAQIQGKIEAKIAEFVADQAQEVGAA